MADGSGDAGDILKGSGLRDPAAAAGDRFLNAALHTLLFIPPLIPMALDPKNGWKRAREYTFFNANCMFID